MSTVPVHSLSHLGQVIQLNKKMFGIELAPANENITYNIPKWIVDECVRDVYTETMKVGDTLIFMHTRDKTYQI